MTSSVSDIDKGWQRIKRETAALAKKSVAVGFPEGSDGEIVERAFYNEYGTKGGASGGGWGGPVPARPFVSTAFDENRDDLNEFKSKLWDRVIAGKSSANDAAALLGQYHQRQVIAKINSITTPANAALTIELKGSAKPLVNSGDMRGAVRFEVE